MSTDSAAGTSGEEPIDAITTAGDGAWIRPCVMPDDLYPLLLMLGNGLDGDVRFVGNTPDAVEMARGLIIGTGACRPMEPPTDAPLYQPGDECYRQHAQGRAFLDPKPTGEVVPRREKRPAPPAGPPPAPRDRPGDEPRRREREVLTRGSKPTEDATHAAATEAPPSVFVRWASTEEPLPTKVRPRGGAHPLGMIVVKIAIRRARDRKRVAVPE